MKSSRDTNPSCRSDYDQEWTHSEVIRLLLVALVLAFFTASANAVHVEYVNATNVPYRLNFYANGFDHNIHVPAQSTYSRTFANFPYSEGAIFYYHTPNNDGTFVGSSQWVGSVTRKDVVRLVVMQRPNGTVDPYVVKFTPSGLYLPDTFSLVSAFLVFGITSAAIVFVSRFLWRLFQRFLGGPTWRE